MRTANRPAPERKSTRRLSVVRLTRSSGLTSLILALVVLLSISLLPMFSKDVGGVSASTPLQLVFPSAGGSSYGSANGLIGSFGSSLGVSPTAPFPDNSHTLSQLWDEQNTSFPFNGAGVHYESYHYWATGDDGTLVGALYNRNDQLVEIKAYQQPRVEQISVNVNGTWVVVERQTNPSIGDWRAASNSAEAYFATAGSLANSLGVSPDLLIGSDFGQDFTTDVQGNVVSTTTTVTLWGALGGKVVAGANHLQLRFTDLNLTSVDVFPFYEASGSLALVKESDAASDSRKFLEAQLESSGPVKVLGGPWSFGLGLDQETLSIAYVFEWYVQLGELPYPQNPFALKTAFVLVGAETGSPVFTQLLDGELSQGRPVSIKGFPYVALAIVLSLVMVGSAVLILTWPPEVLIATFFSLILPLYLRLRSGEILDHYKRGMIHGFIVANPGVYFTEMKRALNLSNGSLVYHLDMLLRNGDVFCRRSGTLMRYYEKDVSLDRVEAHVWTDLQVEMLRFVRSKGRSSKTEIRNAMSASRQTIHYNLKKLNDDGVLMSRVMRGKRYYSVSPGTEFDSALLDL